MPFGLEPMVPGELGRRTVLDRSTHPPIVTATDDCWITEDLHLGVSDRMLEILQAGRLTDCGVEEL